MHSKCLRVCDQQGNNSYLRWGMHCLQLSKLPVQAQPQPSHSEAPIPLPPGSDRWVCPPQVSRTNTSEASGYFSNTLDVFLHLGYVNLHFSHKYHFSANTSVELLWSYSSGITLPDTFYNPHYHLMCWTSIYQSFASLFPISYLEANLHEGWGLQCCALQ